MRRFLLMALFLLITLLLPYSLKAADHEAFHPPGNDAQAWERLSRYVPCAMGHTHFAGRLVGRDADALEIPA